ncbi:hypothetical protein BGW39_006256 [Mortierella sp. 14UC]|nr:hypothetical protein BGW39_006256 [Mortierella sp. 14UC]
MASIVPTEILLALGQHLDGRDLVACLQVCQEWLQVFRPFIWVIITKRHWTRPGFLLTHWTPLSEIDNCARSNTLNDTRGNNNNNGRIYGGAGSFYKRNNGNRSGNDRSSTYSRVYRSSSSNNNNNRHYNNRNSGGRNYSNNTDNNNSKKPASTKDKIRLDADVHWWLRHTRSLTWYNNNALLETKMFMRLPPQMPTSQLVLVLRRTPNLVHFSLVMASHGADKQFLSSILALLRDLPHLTALEIDIPRRDWIVPIKEHLQLFAKLKELKIAGDWYGGVRTLEPMMQQRQQEQGQEQVELYAPWKLQILEIDRSDMSFFPYCPDLEYVAFNYRAYGYGHGVTEDCPFNQRILGQLQGMLRLHTVVLTGAFDFDEREFRIRADKDCEGTARVWELISPDSEKRTWTLQEIVNLI